LGDSREGGVLELEYLFVEEDLILRGKLNPHFFEVVGAGCEAFEVAVD
jgi:hypothetical protein